MKKVFRAALSASCIVLISASSLKAQQNISGLTASLNSEAPTAVDNVKAPHVSEEIYSDFSRKFSHASNAIWKEKEDLTYVYFTEQNIPTRVIYNKQRKLQYVMKFYNGAMVPQRYSALVSKEGYDMTITEVTEITSRYTTTAFIKLEDKTSHLTLQVHPNGDVNVYESFLKVTE